MISVRAPAASTASGRQALIQFHRTSAFSGLSVMATPSRSVLHCEPACVLVKGKVNVPQYGIVVQGRKCAGEF